VFTKLIGLKYKIVYKKGSKNSVVDALSRHSAPPQQLLSISACTLVWMIEVQDGYKQDEKAQQIITELLIALRSVHTSLLWMEFSDTRREYG
jgi:hypothetical protein